MTLLTSRSFWHSLVILLILYQTVSRDSWEALFFCCYNRPPLRLTGKFCSLQISLLKKQNKTLLMRILQRRARLPTLITSYWDHGTRRAQLCFSYASSSQPTFDSHSQDCLLSCRVLIKRGLDGSWVLSVNPRVRRGPQTVWDTSLPFCRSMGTAEESAYLLLPTKTSWFLNTLDLSCFFFVCVSHVWPFNV